MNHKTTDLQEVYDDDSFADYCDYLAYGDD